MENKTIVELLNEKMKLLTDEINWDLLKHQAEMIDNPTKGILIFIPGIDDRAQIEITEKLLELTPGRSFGQILDVSPNQIKEVRRNPALATMTIMVELKEEADAW